LEHLLKRKNKMKNIFKHILLLIGVAILWSDSKAQEGIDTALFKHYKVKKMWVYVKLPIFVNRTLNDSCLAEIYHLDTLSRITYQKNAMGCYGWGNSTEDFNTYDSLNRIIYSKNITEEVETNVKYFYNSKNDVVKIIQKRPDRTDSMVLLNFYTYNKKGLAKELKVFEIVETDTTKYITHYEYDNADNIKVISSYTGDMKLIKKQTFDITPISKKVLEFTTEIKLPKASYSKGWNFYNFDAQLSRTQYSNNTWTEFVYKENGLLDQTLSYNMEGKLNSWKRYFYEFYEGTE